MNQTSPLRKLSPHHRRGGPGALAASLTLTVWLLSAMTGWTQTNLLAVLHTFLVTTNVNPDGLNPTGSLVPGAGNELFGVTSGGGNASGGGGTLFKINSNGSGFQTLHSFALSDTGFPASNIPPFSFLSVIQGSDGILYGSTYGGGTNGAGTIFKIGSNGGGYAELHSFGAVDANPTSLIQGRDGAIYGTCQNCAVFKLNVDGSGYKVLQLITNNAGGTADLFGKLAQGGDGALYGSAYFGGTNGFGSVFKLNPDGSGYTVLYNFGTTPDGNYPWGVIQGSDGALYGTTRQGGANGQGTVFKLAADGSGYTNLHSFYPSTDGGQPFSGLVEGANNLLYGITAHGGQTINGTVNAFGTIYQMNPDGSGFDVLFNNTASCLGGVLLGPFTGGSGALYGNAYSGGGGQGFIFALLINPALTVTPISTGTVGDQAVVFWPSWALNYTLQTTTNLTTGRWITVSNATPVIGVQVTNSQPGAFFRLVQP